MNPFPPAAGRCVRFTLRLLMGSILANAARASATADETRPRRDDGIYQNGGYWATPLPWLMETIMATDPALAATWFCEVAEDFQARGEICEWVNAHTGQRSRARGYCASAAMPLAGARRLRALLADRQETLPPGLASRFDAAESWLQVAARRTLRAASSVGRDGVRIFTPDASGRYAAFWVRDWSYALEGCPDAFNPEEVRQGYLFLCAAQRADGCMPDRVRADGTGIYSPGPESKPFSRNGSVDQSPFMVLLCHQVWRLSGDLGPFRATATALEKAMRFTPRNPINGLVAIEDATLFRPYSFLDTVPLTGDQQFDSVLFWDACQKLADMFQAAGEPERANTWRRDAAHLQKSLASLWDASTNLFSASSQGRQPAIWGSLFAVYAGCATPEQSRAIAGYCRNNLQLFVRNGQTRHLPKGTFWGRPEIQYEDVPPTPPH